MNQLRVSALVSALSCLPLAAQTIRYHLNTLFLLVLPGAATPADAQVQPQLAQRYFEEAKTLCERDAGRLWSVSLCGPMVVVDQATGARATSQPEPERQPPAFRVSLTPSSVL